jgi:hypothetical protein
MQARASGKRQSLRRWTLRLAGAALLLAGISAAILGPLEMYCFTLFSEGGAFHYEGFRFGSFMFGNLAAQILGYYFLAAVLIPLGYGTLRLRSWAHHLALAVVRFWIVAGLPLAGAFFFVLLSSKQLPLVVIGLTAALLAASYLALPWLAVRFYESDDTRLVFETPPGGKTWVETIPVPALALAYTFVFFLLILHTQVFFNGMFPLFGTWRSGLEGIVLIDVSIAFLGFIVWGTIRTSQWAWWGALVYFSLISLSYVATLLLSRWQDILAALDPPAFEMDTLRGLPLQGIHLALFAGLPFLLTLGLIARARPHFTGRGL